jgi:hypothetical protein
MTHRAARLIRVLRAAGLAHRLLVSRRKHNRPVSSAEKARQQQQQRLAQQQQRIIVVSPTSPKIPRGGADANALPLKAAAGETETNDLHSSASSGAGPSQQPESRIGTALSQASHRKVLIGGVLLLIVAPFLTYTPQDDSWVFARDVLREAASSGSAALSRHVAMLVQGALGNVLFLRTAGQVCHIKVAQ